jgi:hypothetical protein
VAACSVSFAQKPKSIEPNTLVKLDGFTILSPPGDDWEYVLQNNRIEVLFINESSNILTGSGNSTIISVYKDSLFVPAEKGEKEYADGFLDENINDFKKIGLEELKIKSSRKFDTTIAGRKLYAIAYTSTYSIRNSKQYLDDIFFLCFPDDFKTSRVFFGFNISSSYNQPLGFFNINSAELKPIFSVMKSFKMKESADPEIKN